MNRAPTTPGEILKELFLEPARVTQLQLARHLGWTPAKVNNLIAGRLGVSGETALSLADAFGTSPEIWMNAQAGVDLWKAKRTHLSRKRLPRGPKSAAA